MWTSNPPIKLLRYLFMLRVNSTLVRLPRFASMEFSLVLGSMIADRLPSNEAKQWHKALSPWQSYNGEILNPFDDESSGSRRKSRPRRQSRVKSNQIPDAPWPIDAILHLYPGKLIHGSGELIVWEIKLLNDYADHRLFLEMILPVVEEAGFTKKPQWYQSGKLWGNFDIDSVYVARGRDWMPLVQKGELDLKTTPTAEQWAEGLHFKPSSRRSVSRLTWLTPFAFDETTTTYSQQTNKQRQKRKEKQTHIHPPSLVNILEATVARLHHPPPEWSPKQNRSRKIAKDAPVWQETFQQAQTISVVHNDLRPAPKYWPGQAIGTQKFSKIPPTLVPYLTLASILHIGQYTHLGCGTFFLSK